MKPDTNIVDILTIFSVVPEYQAVPYIVCHEKLLNNLGLPPLIGSFVQAKVEVAKSMRCCCSQRLKKTQSVTIVPL
jgi:hypothetical protein